MNRRSFVLWAACGGGAFAAGTARGAEASRFRLGVVPNVSARVIVAGYQPLRVLLEQALRRPVEIATAPDFRVFHQRTVAGEYDVVVTAAHLARLAQVDAGFMPVGMFVPTLKGLLVGAQKDLPRTVQDLRGAKLAVANPQSLIAMRGLQWLRERGLRADADYTIVKAANEDSLAHMLLKGEARLALLSNGELRQIPAELRDGIGVLAQIVEVPGFVWLVPARTDPDTLALLRHQMKALDRTEDGRRFLASVGVDNWTEIDGGALATLDAVLPETRQILGITR